MSASSKNNKTVTVKSKVICNPNTNRLFLIFGSNYINKDYVDDEYVLNIDKEKYHIVHHMHVSIPNKDTTLGQYTIRNYTKRVGSDTNGYTVYGYRVKFGMRVIKGDVFTVYYYFTGDMPYSENNFDIISNGSIAPIVEVIQYKV